MKALYLGSGRGERMRPLNRYCTKPLLLVGRRALAAMPLSEKFGTQRALVSCVITNRPVGVSNMKLFGDGRAALGANSGYPLRSRCAGNRRRYFNALPLLGVENILVVNADISGRIVRLATLLGKSAASACLVLVGMNRSAYLCQW